MDLLHFKFYTTCFKWGDDFMKNPEKKTYLVSFVNCQFEKHENIPVLATSREDAESVLLRVVKDAHFVYDIQQSA